jgi:Putative peptidoglycan binding domain
MPLRNPRFATDPVLERCASGSHRMQAPEEGNAVRKVQEALLDLSFKLPRFGVDGKFGNEMGDAVSAYKLSRGLSPADPVVGSGTIDALDREVYPNVELHYWDRKSHHNNVALGKANDANLPDWLPEAGFTANRARIIDLYAYYRDLYLAQPSLFLWAGLGHMAGGAVVGGLDRDPGFIDQTVMVRIGQDIFFDLAWMHEAFLEDPNNIISLADLHDRFNLYPRYTNSLAGYAPGQPTRSYGRAWRKILSGESVLVAEGNRDLLENEQWSIIQPHYEFLRTRLFSGLVSPFTNAIHPYHRAFIVDIPQGNVLVASDRWSWITRIDGMFQRWNDIGIQERTRLVNLAFDQICNGNFGVPGRPELLPPGGP